MSNDPSLSALEKHACPACGAQAEWHPGRQKLVCAFCGTESPYAPPLRQAPPDELDLASALREATPAPAGAQVRQSVQCRSCRAIMLFDPARVGQNCEFCGSPALIAREQVDAPIHPGSLLPFKVDTVAAREAVKRWWGQQWLAPSRLRRQALIDTVHGLYIPYWTFDAAVRCSWEAEAGHYYYVAVEKRDSGGRPVVTRERRVRWEPAHGVIDHVFDDEPVPGTRGIPFALLRQVEPFPTGDLVPYDTAYLSGYVVEQYQVALSEASTSSEAQMHARLMELCAARVPGDTHRNLRISPVFSARTFKHILLPVHVLSYDYGRRAFQVVVNGYTGTVAGRHPYSPWKILLLVLLAIVVIGLLVIAGGER